MTGNIKSVIPGNKQYRCMSITPVYPQRVRNENRKHSKLVASIDQKVVVLSRVVTREVVISVFSQKYLED